MDTYASRMIEAGVFFIGKSPGLYTLQDVFTLWVFSLIYFKIATTNILSIGFPCYCHEA